MGAFQRADGQMRVCMGANVTNTRWVGAIGQAPRGSTASDNARPLARPYRVQVGSHL